MPEQSIEERLSALLDSQDDEAERALQLLYGELPAWFPMPRLEHARRIIYQLGNDGFTPEQIGQFAADEMADKLVVPGAARDSVAFIRAINELAHIKYALSLREDACLELLAGKQATKGRRFSFGGTRKAGREYEPKASIRKICKQIESTHFDDVLEVLRDAERCGDWYESTASPIGVLFTNVDDEEERISYLPRGALPNSQKSFGFKHLRNILAKLKDLK